MSERPFLPAFRRGLRDGLPFVLVIVPFGFLFGVVGSEAGLNLLEVMGFSIFVIAGASQFAAVQMMVENAPIPIVVATALAVNLRLAMYSAALAPHLGAAPPWLRGTIAYFLVDQNYALSALDYETRPDQPFGAKLGYFLGTTAAICPLWYAASLAGAAAGSAAPEMPGLDFAVPITFLAIITPMLRTRAHWAAAAVSVAVALALSWMPHNLGLMVAGLAAMVAGAAVEARWG